MVEKSNSSEDTIVIKKYANRRLYNTATSSYVTLDTLCAMVKNGQDFVVQDAKSGTDITRSVLTQIIFEEESKGQNLLPISFLRQLIGFYGDSLETMVPGYLESTMSAFAQNQDQIRQHLSENMGGANPFRQIEEMGRQNMAMFQQAMGMFTPFAGNAGNNAPPPSQPAAPEPMAENNRGDSVGGGSGAGSEELDLLRRQLAQMQQQLDNLSNKS
ncbi:MAG: polyhydroxyalkanoate synthesis repressor PhaR [Rhodospirillaceae bacterium]|nr:polyhydroxyalkanoate synthesis repressor PhaR [Rhodospirillaceae bacterium]